MWEKLLNPRKEGRISGTGLTFGLLVAGQGKYHVVIFIYCLHCISKIEETILDVELFRIFMPCMTDTK